jgi:hypothetical protein
MALYLNTVACAVLIGVASAACGASVTSDGAHPDGISSLMIPASSEYRRRFQELRRNPALVRGHALRGLSVDVRRLKVADDLRGYSLTLGGKTGNNDGYFILYDPDGTDLRGRADRYVSNENEWIYVLSKIKRGPPLVPDKMQPIEVQYIADLIQTIIDAGARLPVTVFVLYAP